MLLLPQKKRGNKRTTERLRGSETERRRERRDGMCIHLCESVVKICNLIEIKSGNNDKHLNHLLTTFLPKGVIASDINLKCCMPQGIPIIVRVSRIPNSR